MVLASCCAEYNDYFNLLMEITKLIYKQFLNVKVNFLVD
ncbi:extracellular protein of unknown function [Brochothrix thermosphacta]|uniref:Uncharacterized protein n=1 Tax=Brochothrix thermosphacta TaxID=2756 RepID=A0A2X0Q727_BROTH|nr:hypothetical protein FM106_11640 [Brachybacterium faecium]SOC29367.1 hypothetical protein BTH160X_50263 [Brochothrix thermosphacta]SPN72097.1 extracellular protein of unknown function [Brochothrix thermosphacta]SPN75363.1 extracellular hypothetical protein [Brochothrix thermosphacta]SPP25928.1 extracellular hypothetical protein [Brochothrix thermosphacta]